VNNKQESNLDNLNRGKRDKFLNNLEMAKNLLTVDGDIATSVSPLKNISSAKGFILMQLITREIMVYNDKK
jgi:hypothetical protein